MRLPLVARRAEPQAPGVRSQFGWSFSPRSDREAGDAIASNFVYHAFPAKVSKASMAWNYSFWLGTISAALFFLLILSGLPLLFLYVPSVERAYQSVKDIEFVITFGSWIRAVHRIAAHGMVIAVFLHLVRVFLTGIMIALLEQYASLFLSLRWTQTAVFVVLMLYLIYRAWDVRAAARRLVPRPTRSVRVGA